MAGGNPKFGTLDIGQPGGTRETAGSARALIRVIAGREEFAVVAQASAQQNVVFRDNLGFRGTGYTWDCTIKAASDTILRSVLNDIRARMHGAARDANGNLLPPTSTNLKPQLLTDSDGATLAAAAVLADLSVEGARAYLTGGAPYTVLLRCRLEFRVLR